MNLPPFLMRMKIIDDRHHVNLWIPVILLWILMFILAIGLSPIVAVLVLILWPFGWGEFLLMLGPTVFYCVCALKGLTIDVKSKKGNIVLIYFK